jgi:Ser/Thr protein kinase RdoA (MazF antagonist)
VQPCLQRVLARHWDLEAVEAARLCRGHTNESHLLHTATGSYVVRRSWLGRPLQQIRREEAVLDALTARPVPQIVPTRDGKHHVVYEDRVVHVFERCMGDPGETWIAPGGEHRVHAAMTALAELHRHLAAIPLHLSDRDPAQWIRERLVRVQTGDDRALPEGSASVLQRLEQLLPILPNGLSQWVHGDYHLGNLLWHGDRVASIVDFENVAPGTASAEAAMALFALCREDHGDDRFVYDRSLWEVGLAAYEEASNRACIWPDVKDLALVFCAYQVLIHFEAAQHGLWTLSPRIGFWPCWHSLRRGV